MAYAYFNMNRLSASIIYLLFKVKFAIHDFELIKMGTTNVFKTLYRVGAFAFPISANMLISMVSSFIAMLMVAKISSTELAAGALATTTFMTIMTVTTTIFYALGILIGHSLGQMRPSEDVGILVKNSFWLSILLIIPSYFLLWNMDKVLVLCRQDPQLIRLTIPYFHYAALTMIPTLISTVIFQFYTGIGNPKFTMTASVLSFPLLIVASYAFIFGKFDLPRLGLGGVTCAMFWVQSIRGIAILMYMFFNENIKKYVIFSGNFRLDWHLCKKIFLLGSPIGLQFGGELAAMTAATYFMGYFGVAALAASQIVSQYSLLIVMMTLGLSQAISVLISGAYGKADLKLIKQLFNSGLWVLLILFVFVSFWFYLTPKLLIGFYVNVHNPANDIIVHLSTYFFAVAAIALLLDGLRNLLAGALRGVHDSKAPMQIGIVCLWLISLPACYIMAFVFKGGPIGLQIGFASGFIISSVLLWRRMQKKLMWILAEQSTIQ